MEIIACDFCSKFPVQPVWPHRGYPDTYLRECEECEFVVCDECLDEGY